MSDRVHTVHAKGSIWRLSTGRFREARRVAMAFARRDVNLRYVQTRLGWFWAVGQPVLAALLILLVFSYIVGVKAPNDLPYALYAFAALPGWLMAQGIIVQGGPSLIHNQHILRKIAFPREALIQSKALVSLMDFGVASVLFAILSIGIHGQSAAHFWAWPLVLIYTILSTLGIAYWIAALSTKFRDLIAILPVLVQGLFLLSPIAYPSDRFAAALGESAWLLYLNPMVAMAEGFRFAWLGPDFVLAGTDYLMLSAGMGFVLFLTGHIALRVVDRNLVDTI